MEKMPVINYKQENVFKKGTKFGSLTSKKIKDFTFWPKIGHIYKFTFENAINVVKVDMNIIDTFWVISVNFHNMS